MRQVASNYFHCEPKTNDTMTTFLIMAGAVLTIIIILKSIKSKTTKRKSILDALKEDPKYKEMHTLYKAMEALNEGGTEEDMIPEGYGEFGLEVTNPIPVNTVMGSIAYLGRLRTLDGQKVEYNRIGSTSADNIDKPIDVYEILLCGKEFDTIYISPYNKKNSERAPKGYTLGHLNFIAH